MKMIWWKKLMNNENERQRNDNNEVISMKIM